MNWYKANLFCRENDMFLTTKTVLEQNKQLFQRWLQYGGGDLEYVLIGPNIKEFITSKKARLEDWRGVNGEKLNENGNNLWEPKQPDRFKINVGYPSFAIGPQGALESCAELKRGGVINDVDCHGEYYFLCTKRYHIHLHK